MASTPNPQGPSASELLSDFGLAEPPQESSIDVRRYLDALRKRWWIVVLAAAAAAGVTLVYTSRQPRLYQAQATIIIDTSTNSNILSGVQDVVQLGTGGFWATEAFYEKEYRVIQSRAVARRAGEIIGVLSDDTWTGLDAVKDAVERDRQRAELDPADFVLGRYSVEPEKTQNIVHIIAVSAHKERTALIANAVAKAYMELNGERRVDGTRDAGTWLSVQYAELKKKLEASEDELYRFMEENNVLNASLESQLESVKQRLNSFNARLAEVQAARIQGQTDADMLKLIQEEPSLVDSIYEVQTAPVVSSLKTALADLETEWRELAARYQPAHPKMLALAEKRHLLEQRLEKEISNIIAALNRQQTSMAATEEGLKVALATERQREARLNKLQLDYRRLKRDVDTNERLFTLVTTRMKETDLTGALHINNVSILEKARDPGGAFRPSYRNNLSVGVFLGLLLGIALVLVLDLLDNTLKNQEDVATVLPKTPFLGIVPLIDVGPTPKSTGAKKDQYFQERDLYVMKHPKSTPAECLRFVRSNLMFMTPDKPLRTVLVTSPSPREGKTTTAINLAVTMAQSGGRTLIVDTDMRRPRLHRAFGVPNDKGLSSCIVGDSTLLEAVQATDAPGLDVLVCGPVPPNPAELLHTQSFSKLIEQMKEKYTRIVFDSPPVGAVTDPVIVGTQVDGTVVVLKYQETTKASAKQAVRTLTDANVPLFGCLLNDVDLAAKRYGSDYYAYYRKYGYYYGESQSQGAEA